MAFDPFTALGEIGAGIVGIFKAKQEAKSKVIVAEAEARVAVLQKAAEQEATWENIWAEQASTSWKDEFWTIVLAIPMIMCFIPGLELLVAHGFSQLDKTPEWYRYAVGTAIGAAFGLRAIARFVGK